MEGHAWGRFFLMPYTECAHRQAQTRILNDTLFTPCSGLLVIRPGLALVRSRVLYGEHSILSDAAYTDTSLHFKRRLLLHITISIHSMEFSLGMSTAARLSLSPSSSVLLSVTAGLGLPGTCTQR